MGDAGDVSRRLGELLALAAGDLGSLREAIDELDREEAGELLLAAVLRVMSLEAAVSFAAETGEHESPGPGRLRLRAGLPPRGAPWRRAARARTGSIALSAGAWRAICAT